MCGIAGVYDFRNHRPVSEAALRRGCDAMAHRGPDGDGMYRDDDAGLGFGHRRLSIIDIEGGAQPMSTADGRLWITFNGEIYNFRELRADLEKAGVRFHTNCDTEVILYGYRHWGDDVVNRLRGMFAFGLWDAPRRRLLLARDHAGVKPLYYRECDGQVVFASEVKAIEAFAGRKFGVDPTGLYAYIRMGYTPAPYTMFEGVNKLAPGTKLVVDGDGLAYSRYWNYTPRPALPAPSFDDAAEGLLERYTTAVQRNLVSDVPVGLLLSGGLDSGLLLALMNRFGSGWKTFTVGFGSQFEDDELDDAARVAAALGSDHASVHITRDQFERTLSHIVGYLEEPVSTASIVPMYFVSERARQDVKVALIGQGPDELLSGYRRHIGIYYGEFYRRMPGAVHRAVRGALEVLPGLTALRRASYSLDVPDRLTRYMNILTLVPPQTIDDLLQPGAAGENAESRILHTWAELVPMMSELDELNAFNFWELRSFLADHLLIYGDKLSMAHSLEVRVPYLDVDVIEYVETLPSRYKIALHRGKRLQRKICASHLPPEVITRRKKGFAVNVVDEWFRSAFAGHMPDLLRDPQSHLFEFLDPAPTARLLEQHQRGQRNNYRILFSLVLLEEWLRAR